MIEALQDFTASLPPVVQWLGVMLAGAVPFIESYLGAVVGVVAGISPPVAIAAAVLGNVASMLVLVTATDALRAKVARPRELSPKRRKLRNAFDKYGVAGVSLIGQTILPSQITSAAMVSFGAPKATVIRWQVISIIVWGAVFGTLAALGIDLLGNR